MADDSSKVAHLIAGCAGGAAATLVLHPLDLIKVRLQVQDVNAHLPVYRGTVHAFTEISKSEGFLALYRGVGANTFGAGLAWGSYFYGYEHLKRWLRTTEGNGTADYMLAAGLAGTATLILTNPIWVVKTRMCLQGHKEAHLPYQYRGLLHGLASIYRGEGFAGLYKGFLPGLFGVSHGAVQFAVYEKLKTLLNIWHGDTATPNKKLSTVEYIGMAASSKAVAQIVTYPYQVVRSRLQETTGVSPGAVGVIKTLLSTEGVRGLYKGLWANLLRVLPATCLTFVVYEHTRAFVDQHSHKSS